MPTRIRITAGAVSHLAELNDSPTAATIQKALPIEARANTWGHEIYFAIPVGQGLDDTAVEVVQVGDLGYWPTGRAFCIFFRSHSGQQWRPDSACQRGQSDRQGAR